MRSLTGQKGITHLFLLLVVTAAILGYTLIFPQVKNKLGQFSSLYQTAQASSTYSPKILLVIYNPIIESQGGQKLTALKGWSDPDSLSQTLITNFSTNSASKVSYTIAQKVEIDGYPIKNSGFQLTDDYYLTNCQPGINDPNCDSIANYQQILADSRIDACGKRNRGEIDEVWMWGGPWFGYWESNLAGPKAFWYNSDPTIDTSCEKLLPIMGFNYERGQAEALESYAHRVESTLKQVYGSWDAQYTHNWNKFAMLDVNMPGKGGCGNAHLAVNATSYNGYDTTNTRIVPSSCEDFLNYPNLTGNTTNISCNTWGCNTTGYFNWWYSHLPKADGVGPDGKLNNWWSYIVDPENTIANPPLTDREDKLIAYWKMDEESGNTASDTLGLRSGNAIGNVTIVDSKAGFGKARNLDGTNTTRVDLGDKPNFELATFSISAWVYRKGNCNFNHCDVFSKGESGNSGYSLRVRNGGSGYKAEISLKDSLQLVASNTIIDTNKWYHLVGVVGEGQVKLYVNGVLESQAAQTQIPTFGDETGKIGNGNSNIDLGFNGIIDEVALWNRVLPDSEVLALYGGGNGQDVLTKLPLFTPAPTPSPSPTPTPSPSPTPITLGNINGKVLGNNNKGLAGVIVSLNVGGVVKTYTTNSLGNYQASNIASGTYLVTYSAKGYTSQVKSVTVTSGITTTQNVSLRRK